MGVETIDKPQDSTDPNIPDPATLCEMQALLTEFKTTVAKNADPTADFSCQVEGLLLRCSDILEHANAPVTTDRLRCTLKELLASQPWAPKTTNQDIAKEPQQSSDNATAVEQAVQPEASSAPVSVLVDNVKDIPPVQPEANTEKLEDWSICDSEDETTSSYYSDSESSDSESSEEEEEPVPASSILSSVLVDSSFVKKPFDVLEKEYREARRARRLFCAEEGYDKKLGEREIVYPTYFLLMANLECLDVLVQFICSCIPASGIVGHPCVAKKVDALIGRLQSLFTDSPDSPPCPTLTILDAYVKRKRMLKSQKCALLGVGSKKTRLLRVAYDEATLPKLSYFNSLVAFTSQLARVCQAMVHKAKSNGVLDSRQVNLVKAMVTSFKHLRLHIPAQVATIPLLVLKQVNTGCMHHAFTDLNEFLHGQNYTNCVALKKQKVGYAIALFAVLWHVIKVMHHKLWISTDVAKIIRHKLDGLQKDARCNKYQERSADNTGYVWRPLRPFWGANKYGGMFNILVNNDNGHDHEVMAQDFCVALTRNAAACTPILFKRGPELSAWIELVKEAVLHN
jgi:hypothetical protein